MEIKEALAALDHGNDEHWNEDGTPSLDMVRELTGDEAVTRQQIVDADPEFVRATTEDADEATDAKVVEEEAHVRSIRIVENDVSEVDLKIAELQAKKDQLERERSAIYQKGHFEYDHKRDQERRTEYIRKQHELQMQKEMKRREVFKALGGQLKPEEIDSRTPLDRAMATRKPGRGTGRPQRLPNG